MRSAVVYTDGSGVAPPGAAGIAYVAIGDGVRVERSERLERASSQQAELLAAELALRELPVCDEVVVWSDSQYLVKGMTEWLSGWIRRGWRKSDGAPVLNRDQWELLLAARLRHGTVEFRWVRGHAGTRENERADYLAFRARIDGLSEGYRESADAFFALRDER